MVVQPRTLRRLLRCERGATILMTAILGTAVMMGGLAAFDVARLHLTKTRLQTAVDAAALAATRDIASSSLAADARKVFDANYVPGFLGTRSLDTRVVDGFSLRAGRCDGGGADQELDAEAAVMEICVEAAVRLDSVLWPMLGPVAPALFEVEARATTIRRNQGVELALVLDNTGSMRGNDKIGDLRRAAQLLIDILYNGKSSIPNLQVAVVPYTATVNIGPQHEDWLLLEPAGTGEAGDDDEGKGKGKGKGKDKSQGRGQGLDRGTGGGGDEVADRVADGTALEDFAPTTWKGCVLARTAGQDQTDATPAVAAFLPQWYPPSPPADCTPFPDEQGERNCWPDDSGAVDERNEAENNGYGPNLGCGPAITPLTPDYAVVSAAIREMLPWHRGGTMANMGLVWGWRTLAPSWRGLWLHADGTPIDPDRPFAHGHPATTKVVVLMTDGDNLWYQNDFTAYRFRTDDVLGNDLTSGQAKTEIDKRMTSACNAMKAEGIVIYTITFGGSPNAATRALYRGCASSPTQNPAFPGQKYFHAPSGDDLRDAFMGIAGQLTELRLMQ